MHKELFALWHT